MNKQEAKDLLNEVVTSHKDMSYTKLKVWVDSKKVESLHLKGRSGQEYQLELQAFWDDKKAGTIRFMGSINVDGAAWRSIFRLSLTDDFIIRPDGSFVTE